MRHGHAADHKDDIWQANDIAISARAAKRHWIRLAARDWWVCANEFWSQPWRAGFNGLLVPIASASSDLAAHLLFDLLSLLVVRIDGRAVTIMIIPHRTSDQGTRIAYEHTQEDLFLPC